MLWMICLKSCSYESKSAVGELSMVVVQRARREKEAEGGGWGQEASTCAVDGWQPCLAVALTHTCLSGQCRRWLRFRVKSRQVQSLQACCILPAANTRSDRDEVLFDARRRRAALVRRGHSLSPTSILVSERSIPRPFSPDSLQTAASISQSISQSSLQTGSPHGRTSPS